MRDRTVVPAASGIVLAGGRATRFGRDKLVEPVSGRPLVQHAVLALAHVAREVVVVVAPVGDPPPLPGRDEVSVPLRVVRDPEPAGGPLIGALAGLEQAGESLALVCGGDMPSLAEPVLAALLRRLDSGDGEAVALVLRGRRHQLPLAVRVGAASAAATRLIAEGERSLTALMRVLRTVPLADAEWRSLDPAGRTLADIDRPADLPR